MKEKKAIILSLTSEIGLVIAMDLLKKNKEIYKLRRFGNK